MSDDVMRDVGKAPDRPTRAEVLARLQAQPVLRLEPTAAAIIRAQRDSR
ncbi:MAG: hypothetical protein KA371_12240 [Acidobacteria bacterium]|nr:hypothetical protein [Acidobacteriota bacterium]